MATGLTGSIYDGTPTTLREFALRCARMFGPLISMRDHGLDAPIPDIIEPSAYHQEALERARRDLAEAGAMTDDAAGRMAAEAHEKRLHEAREGRARIGALRARYEAMLAEVTAWQVPTPDHEDLKKFMTEQLTESIEHDCIILDEPGLMTGAEFKAERVRHAKWEVEYHEKHAAEEEARVRFSTRWIGALKGSLPG